MGELTLASAVTLSDDDILPIREGDGAGVKKVTVADLKAYMGGGGGGGAYEAAPVAPPLAATFTALNQGLSSLTDITDPVPGLLLSAPSNGGGDNLRCYVQSPPASGQFSVTARVSAPSLYQFGGAGLVLRNSANGRIYAFFLSVNSGGRGEVNSYTAFNGGGAGIHAAQLYESKLWMRITVDGTNIAFDWSPDGANWQVFMTSVTIASFIGAIDQIGIASNPYGVDHRMVVYSYEVEDLS